MQVQVILKPKGHSSFRTRSGRDPSSPSEEWISLMEDSHWGIHKNCFWTQKEHISRNRSNMFFMSQNESPMIFEDKHTYLKWIIGLNVKYIFPNFFLTNSRNGYPERHRLKIEKQISAEGVFLEMLLLFNPIWGNFRECSFHFGDLESSLYRWANRSGIPWKKHNGNRWILGSHGPAGLGPW